MKKQESADEVVAVLRQIIRAIDLHSKQLTKKYGLTGPQLIVMKAIWKSADRPISEIAREVSLSQATVTSILDRLEQQGFVVRHRSQKDKRKVNLDLTEKAMLILENHPSLLQDGFSRQFDELEEWETHMIIAALKRLASMMNADTIQAASVLAVELYDET